jgi:hypothetical protein
LPERDFLYVASIILRKLPRDKIPIYGRCWLREVRDWPGEDDSGYRVTRNHRPRMHSANVQRGRPLPVDTGILNTLHRSPSSIRGVGPVLQYGDSGLWIAINNWNNSSQHPSTRLIWLPKRADRLEDIQRSADIHQYNSWPEKVTMGSLEGNRPHEITQVKALAPAQGLAEEARVPREEVQGFREET